jgi:hypothetical protein
MMYPTIDEALDAIVTTVENEITPHVHDDLASSLCLTVAQMLRSVRARVVHEVETLHEDNDALRQLLMTWGPDLPDPLRRTAAEAVADQPPPVHPTLASLQADAARLRAALVAAIDATPDAEHGLRQAARGYITQQLTHEKLWMQDAFTGPRR